MANNDIRVTLPEQSNLSATVYDINYIPDYIKAEQERRANETIRIANEQERIALAQDLEYKRDTDYWRGDKGDTGATPDISATASVDSNIGTPSVTVTRTGTDEEPNFDFAFSNLKGEKGDTGSYTAGDNIDITDGTIKTLTKGIEYIEGTKSSAMYAEGKWLGTTTDTACKEGTIYVGKTLVYKVPSHSTTSSYATTLNLTLPDGTTTGEIFIYVEGTSATTKTFRGGETLVLTYTGTGWYSSTKSLYNIRIGSTALDFTSSNYYSIKTEGTYNSSTNKLVTKSYVDDIVGDIDSVLDAINGEVI